MKVLVTILILAALIGSLAYFAHRAAVSFKEELLKAEAPEPGDVTSPEPEKAEENLSSTVHPIEQVKSVPPRDPKTGRFIKKQ